MQEAKIISLVQKLQALADRGDPGEKELAEQKLQELLQKYDISDVSDIVEDYHDFRYKEKWEQKLLWQIGYKVLNNTDSYTRKSNNRELKRVVFKCTEAQALEIEYLFSFYKELYQKDVAVFMSAFINKHQLFGDNKEDGGSTMTAEEYMRLLKLQSVMTDETPYTAIERKD